MVRKNWRNSSVAVAEAMSGRVSPVMVSISARSVITWKVGMMRTSTGSIRVMKIIQKKTMRSGKEKNTTAKADSREIAIFPTAIRIAMMRLFHSMVLAGTAKVLRPPPPSAQARA